MEDMDIDQVVDVPDTPDRLASRHITGRESVGKVCNSPLACDLSNPDVVDENYVNGLKVRGRFVSENGHNRRIVIHPPTNLSNLDIKSCSNSNVDNSSASHNAHIFRRATVGKSSSREAKYSTGIENMDEGKAMTIKVPSKSSACHENAKFFDLTKHNGHTQLTKKVFPHVELEDNVAEDKRKGQVALIGSSSVDCISSHAERSRNAPKGKEKIDGSTKGFGLAVALDKGVGLSIDPEHKMGQQMPVPLHSVMQPRVSGQKRLVRNGCISPHNIATRTKQLAEQRSNSSKDIEQSHTGNADSNGSPYVIDINDIVTEGNNSERLKGKGKGVIIHSPTPKANNARIIRTSGSGLVNNNKEANGIRDVSSNISGRSEGLGGWRTTRNRSSQIDYFLPDSTEPLPRRTNGVGNFVNQHQNRVQRRDTRSRGNRRTEDDVAEELNATQKASGLVSELDRIPGSCHAAKTVTKRQRKQGLSLGNHAECSTSVSGDSDIAFLGSSENSKSSRIQRPQFQGRSSRVIEVDDLSPAAGHSVPQGFDSMNDDSNARARQLEADEILARELQEQLYHEVPISGGGEIDEHLAWALQQEENASNTSRGSHNLSHRRGSTILHSNRQSRPESFQNHSNRRGTQARVATSSRMAQLRTRFRNQSPRVSTRGRNMRFPLDMDLDMRLNILEAIEAAFDDLGEVGLDNRMLRVQRDFNDNDYEMLLALDDNNHQHAGATVHQINNLPQSTVQSDASEEACAICLETPTIGETVRHLPCLHRFHKDCIDPWLGRRTSCPICKCSIT
ncbi:hypothetical protein PRUPE_1G003200 [Prunus persica]|uniref:RING-type domain-containing protein n=1 Tax=Prunus persica TaxID=3760 RepID=M5XCH8_PRUPE|nr:E3 ubiquitin-protein ligase RLIM isoform X2 [Prunus persica]ONI26090.1 hypothetical protein PRUPE_1G003200 [Prunus persica]ONI26091.1 hypothetical protein PRUPE_1G003200 [Prunus persica]ONI26092.1 hypothetical protein PRUPE_1G003200 [Prunus persica]